VDCSTLRTPPVLSEFSHAASSGTVGRTVSKLTEVGCEMVGCGVVGLRSLIILRAFSGSTPALMRSCSVMLARSSRVSAPIAVILEIWSLVRPRCSSLVYIISSDAMNDGPAPTIVSGVVSGVVVIVLILDVFILYGWAKRDK